MWTVDLASRFGPYRATVIIAFGAVIVVGIVGFVLQKVYELKEQDRAKQKRCKNG